MYFLNIINSIGDSYLAWKNVYNIIGKILVIMMVYKTLYWLIGVFFTRKFKPAKNKHAPALKSVAYTGAPDKFSTPSNIADLPCTIIFAPILLSSAVY